MYSGTAVYNGTHLQFSLAVFLVFVIILTKSQSNRFIIVFDTDAAVDEMKPANKSNNNGSRKGQQPLQQPQQQQQQQQPQSQSQSGMGSPGKCLSLIHI